jgi:hypothetical protein
MTVESLRDNAVLRGLGDRRYSRLLYSGQTTWHWA